MMTSWKSAAVKVAQALIVAASLLMTKMGTLRKDSAASLTKDTDASFEKDTAASHTAASFAKDTDAAAAIQDAAGVQNADYYVP